MKESSELKTNIHACIFGAICIFFSGNTIAKNEMTFSFRESDSPDQLGTIYASGMIVKSSAKSFEEFVSLNGLKGRVVVALDSPGGSILGGVQLGQAIRRNSFDTNVMKLELQPDSTESKFKFDTRADCLSACVYAYVGGVRRWLFGGAGGPDGGASRIGVHQFYYADDSLDTNTQATTQLVSGAIVSHLESMGVSPKTFYCNDVCRKRRDAISDLARGARIQSGE